MRTSFLPGEFREQLEGLQDQEPPRPLAEVAARLRDELGGSPEELFAAFDRQPIAAASLAQVHEARLADGRRVAVKVQHVGIEAMARRDLDTMRRILGVVALFVRIRGLPGIHAQLRTMIEEELDFGREATNIAAIAAAFAASSRCASQASSAASNASRPPPTSCLRPLCGRRCAHCLPRRQPPAGMACPARRLCRDAGAAGGHLPALAVPPRAAVTRRSPRRSPAKTGGPRQALNCCQQGT